VSSLVSCASGGNIATADRRYTGESHRSWRRPAWPGSAPARVCATGVPMLIAPTRPATATAVRPPGQGRVPARAPQPHHAPQATKRWPRRQLSLSG